MTKSKTGWIIGNGPSLANIDVSRLKGETTVSFNRAYIAYEDWGFDPTYFLVIDSNDMRSIYKDVNGLIENSKIEKFFLPKCDDNRKHEAKHFQDQEKVGPQWEMITKRDNVYFIEPGPNDIAHAAISEKDKTFITAHHQNAGWMGLKLLYTLGYREIAFVGCDSRYRDDEDANKYITKEKSEYVSHADYDVNHFRHDYFGKGQRFGKPNQNRIIKIWRKGRHEIDSLRDLKVFSCTENSTLNDWYDYIPFEEFLDGKR